MLSIDKELFQWEKGRYVSIASEAAGADFVQFYNSKSKNAISVNVKNNTAKIPNELLEVNLPITALICIKNEEGDEVVHRKTFKVLYRPKPETYIDPDPSGPDSEIVFDGGVEE